MTPALFPHQVSGAEWLKENRQALLGFEMRLGKTRTVITAVEDLWRRGEVDAVVVMAYAQGRNVWADPEPEMGDVAKFATVPTELEEHSVRKRRWQANVPSEDGRRPLRWVVSNYEFARRETHLPHLLSVCGPRTVLVLDESGAVSDYRSATAKSCLKMRRRCGRVWELNGTPWGDNPEDQFGQFHLLDPQIIGCNHISEFRARYAVMDTHGHLAEQWVYSQELGQKVKMRVPVEVKEWVNLDDLSRRTAPYVLRMTMEEAFPNMPRALPPATLEVTLSAETWRLYREMRRDALAWLSENQFAAAPVAGVKALRLAQLCSGFIGGVDGDEPGTTREVSTEKRDAVVEWFRARQKERPDFKCVLWCRFLAEAEGLAMALCGTGARVELMTGRHGPGTTERENALRLLHPRTARPGWAALVGTSRSGAMSQNFAAASDMVYVSNDWSLLTRQQSAARIMGPDQRRSASYLDVVAVGPKGERTADHAVAAGLRAKRDVAEWTAREWLLALKEG